MVKHLTSMISNIVRLLVGLALASVCAQGAEAASQPTARWRAEHYQRKTIYHSPETPGYTCWVGLWNMPDQSLLVTFRQAT